MEKRIDQIIELSFIDSIELKKQIQDSIILSQIAGAGKQIIECLKNKGKIIFSGNGGSFADSQHLAAEFISRFLFDRDSLPAIALGTNNSSMSAIGNDYGYESVFSRELDALGNESDIFIPITTSGNSPNLIEAVKIANKRNIKIIALTGKTGGALDRMCECIKVPSTDVPRIQESHILIGHILCQIAEEGIFKPSN
jgi:D-sedoheptulose 7-phosphate isomerase